MRHSVLGPIADRILPELSVGMQLAKNCGTPQGLGSSRLGGLPDVGEDFQWPRFHGRPLEFLVQINCAETSRIDPDQVLPASGILHFFSFSATGSLTETDSEGNPAVVVLYTTSNSLRTAAAPPDLDSSLIAPAYPIAFFPHATLPEPTLELDEIPASYQLLRLSDEQTSAYMKVLSSLPGEGAPGPAHLLLGQPIPIRNNEMQMECEIETSGMSYNDPALAEGAIPEELLKRAAEWRLLLQLSDDDDLNFGWYGSLYLWIRRADLQRRDFSSIWPIVQIH